MTLQAATHDPHSWTTNSIRQLHTKSLYNHVLQGTESCCESNFASSGTATGKHQTSTGCPQLTSPTASKTDTMEGTRRFDPQNIPLAIAALHTHSDTRIPVLSEKYFDGGQCRIYKVDFPDGESWAVRIPLHVQNASRETIIGLLQVEIKTLQELEVKGFRWSPRLQGSSLTFENSVGYPFIALSWVSGEALSWSLEHPARPIRDKILCQAASIIMSLIECTREQSKTGISLERLG